MDFEKIKEESKETEALEAIRIIKELNQILAHKTLRDMRRRMEDNFHNAMGGNFDALKKIPDDKPIGDLKKALIEYLKKKYPSRPFEK